MTDVLSGLDAAGRERVAELRAHGRFFWLDVSLCDTSRDELRDVLGVAEPALGSASASGAYARRAVVADGTAVAFDLRCYVEPHRLGPVKVRVVITGDCLLTLHQERLSLPSLLGPDAAEHGSRAHVVYSVLDTLLATVHSALDEIGARLDVFASSATDMRGGRIRSASLRPTVATLTSMRRWATAEQTVFQRVGVEIAGLPGFETGDEAYFDRLGEQVDRVLASIDAAANGLGMLLDLHLNERAYIVSVLATIFVPLTLVTGYFGMNFGWMVNRIDSPVAYWLLGFLLPVVSGLVSWRLLVRPFLLGDSTGGEEAGVRP